MSESEKKPYTGFLIAESILLVLAAVCSLVVGLLAFFGVFAISDALWLLITCIVVTVCALVLWAWFLCICSSLRKTAK